MCRGNLKDGREAPFQILFPQEGHKEKSFKLLVENIYIYIYIYIDRSINQYRYIDILATEDSKRAFSVFYFPPQKNSNPSAVTAFAGYNNCAKF